MLMTERRPETQPEEPLQVLNQEKIANLLDATSAQVSRWMTIGYLTGGYRVAGKWYMRADVLEENLTRMQQEAAAETQKREAEKAERAKTNRRGGRRKKGANEEGR